MPSHVTPFRRWSFGLCAGLALAACGGRASQSPFLEAAPSAPSGAYEYVANLPGHRVEGMIAIVRDTIILEARDGRCKPLMGAASLHSITYECLSVGRYDVVLFLLDRRNAVQRSRWTAIERVVRKRQVCAEYAMRSGRRVCVRYTEETYEDSLRHTGTLQLTPRSSDPEAEGHRPEGGSASRGARGEAS